MFEEIIANMKGFLKINVAQQLQSSSCRTNTVLINNRYSSPLRCHACLTFMKKKRDEKYVKSVNLTWESACCI